MVPQWLSKDDDPTPLTFFKLPRQSLEWVLHKAKEIQQFVGSSCDEFEEKFMALLMAIEVAHSYDKKSDSNKHRKLKRLSWSLNYEGSAN